MRTIFCKWMPVIGVLVMASFMIAGASAQCGLSKNYKPATFHPQTGSAHRMRAGLFDEDDDRDQPSIVGMWHVVFTAHTQNGQPIPAPGAPFDNSLVTWHGDGTEIMNSSRPAQDGNFCMGVWQRTGERSYFLNHIPWQGNDPSNAPAGIGNPSGGAQLLEQVTLSRDGNSYTGSFSFVAYDTTGKPEVALTGTISATRVTVHTPFSSLL